MRETEHYMPDGRKVKQVGADQMLQCIQSRPPCDCRELSRDDLEYFVTNCLIQLLRLGFFDQVTPYLLEILCDDPENSSFKDAVAIELSRSGLDWAQQSVASNKSDTRE